MIIVGSFGLAVVLIACGVGLVGLFCEDDYETFEQQSAIIESFRRPTCSVAYQVEPNRGGNSADRRRARRAAARQKAAR